MKTFICFLCLVALASAYTKKGATGRTIQTNGSQADVQAAINSAPDDGSTTVIIPEGTHRWSGTLSITKSVSLAGTEGTVIENANATSPMISATSGSKGNINIYGFKVIQVVDNGGSSGTGQLSCDRTEPSNYTVLVHDCTLDTAAYWSYAVWVRANGIIFWNDIFPATRSTPGLGLTGISFTCSKYGYTSSWNTPDSFGGQDTTGLSNSYVEDCSFSHGSSFACNFDDNSRVVWRHNVMSDSMCGSHGQESGMYGARGIEVYNNTFTISYGNPYLMSCWITFRGGSGVVCNNAMQVIGGNKTAVQLNVYSISKPYPIGCQTAYPAARQTGQAWSAASKAPFGNPVVPEDGTGAVTKGVYVWGNTGWASNDNLVSLYQYTDECGNGQLISDYLVEGRDYFLDVAMPGYTPYEYPHPLHAAYALGGGGGPGPSPTPNPTPTPTPQPTPSPSPAPSPTPIPIGRYSEWLDKLSDWIRAHPATPNH